MYLYRGDLPRASAAVARALGLVPGYLPALGLKGRIAARQVQPAEAARLLRHSLRRRASSEDALRLVEVLESTDDAEGARSARVLAEKLAEHDPRPLAHFLARRGEHPERALVLAQQELKARHNVWAHDTHALALLRTGDPERAFVAIARAQALGTPDAGLHLHAALIEAALGHPASARQQLRDAIALDAGVDPRLVAELERKLGKG